MDKAKIVFGVDLVANLQSAKQVMPTIRPFDDPAPGPEARVLSAFLFFLAARFDVGDISATLCRATQLRIVVALVTTEMLARLLVGRWPGNDHGVQSGAKLLHVVPVRAREGDRQGDAVRVREQVPLGAQFAPIGGVFADLVPPLTGAEMMTPSSDWKRQSMPRRSS